MIDNTLLQEVSKEIFHVFCIAVILAWGIMACDAGNRIAIHDQAVYEAQFNLDPQEGDGWVIAATHGGKND